MDEVLEQKLGMPLNDTLLVGFDFTRKPGVLIVGKKSGEALDILNAFEGEDARALYDLLTEKSKACTDNENRV